MANGMHTEIKKIAVLISGRGSNLQSIYHAIIQKKLPVKIALVISNRQNAEGLTFCAENDIHHVVIPSQNKGREVFDEELRNALLQDSIDLIVLAGFMRILTPIIIDEFPNKIINIHPSLLPKYKGLQTHQRAIDAQDRVAGASVHVVTAGLDDGPVIAQVEVPIYTDDSSESLAERVLSEEHRLYAHVITQWGQGLLQFNDEGIFISTQQLQAPLKLI
jgi:phosphoribosylglycinamide formyltransferase-1